MNNTEKQQNAAKQARRKDHGKLRLVHSGTSEADQKPAVAKLQIDHKVWTERVCEAVPVDQKQTLEYLLERELCLLRLVQIDSSNSYPSEIEHLICDNIVNIETRLKRIAKRPVFARAS